MLVFAHIFAGTLIGLGFWHLTQDRRIFLFCMLGALIPDILDKPLAFLFPEILGSGRTLGHTLLFAGVIVATGIFLWHYRHTFLFLPLGCTVFTHQVLDAMWQVPVTWYFPLMGPFSISLIPDYLTSSLWREASAFSEWVFACASVVIIAGWFLEVQEHRPAPAAEKRLIPARITVFILLVLTGIVLLIPITGLFAATIFAPAYDPVTSAMAGTLALGGAVILAHEYGLSAYLGNLPV